MAHKSLLRHLSYPAQYLIRGPDPRGPFEEQSWHPQGRPLAYEDCSIARIVTRIVTQAQGLMLVVVVVVVGGLEGGANHKGGGDWLLSTRKGEGVAWVTQSDRTELARGAGTASKR